MSALMGAIQLVLVLVVVAVGGFFLIILARIIFPAVVAIGMFLGALGLIVYGMRTGSDILCAIGIIALIFLVIRALK